MDFKDSTRAEPTEAELEKPDFQNEESIIGQFRKALSSCDTTTACKLLQEHRDMDLANTRLNVGYAYKDKYLCMTAVEYAADKGWSETLKELLSNRPTANTVNRALHSAAWRGGTAVFSLLCSHGADVNAVWTGGRTPLMAAFQFNNLEAVRILCESGADVNKGDEKGLRALFWAAESNPEITKLLCAYGAEVDHRLVHGSTALMRACRAPNSGVVAELLRQKCDVNINDFQGNQALHIACYSGSFHRNELLVIIQLEKCLTQQTETVKLLLAHPPVDYNHRNKSGDTVLHWTISSLEKITVHKEFRGHRDMHIITALIANSLQIVQLLIRAGCSVTTKASNGESQLTSLLKAMESVLEKAGCMESLCGCVMLLMSAGCPVTDTDLQLMNSNALRPALAPTCLLERASEKAGTPAYLKALCKFAVRDLTRKPLPDNVHGTGLPEYLQKYVLLDVDD